MPVNETGCVIIHKGLGNRIIQPGQEYPGREVGSDGNYLPDKVKEAPKESPGDAGGNPNDTTTPEKTAPKLWPDRESLRAMELPQLKVWAKAQGVDFHHNAGEEKVLDAVDAARAAAAAGDQ
jgi:hypothetical protein